ncbi:Asp-tRNA(Asn)/Glu-tRNA(Gln) amidotransferase subunit GatB [Patescibacteria group bacterium]|nr:MAG: Asp-tRNA(Asn)/Glu-tRNA(Gln) amidotransferase subunit GatB [Patescibacteria group bacterium]
MSAYTPTIGLEIHAELKTRTKMFCNSLNNPDEENPNVNICPVCLAFPGTLPVVNKEAVKQVLRMGVALGGTLADYTEFDRKNYFYPDLPKGYQISQQQFPLVSGGALNGFFITRIHLEEDAARTQHSNTASEESGYSLIDFNRAGLPLMELVTEPCIHDAKSASEFASELQRLLRALGAGDAHMEKGQMRVEANISISKNEKLGTKVEVKNLNSFKSVERAIQYEISRQEEVLESGGTLIQETRGWDEMKLVTYSQRIKEDSEEYRYFPDPDIPKFHLSQVEEFSVASIKESLPELPWEKRTRYMSLGLKAHDIETLIDNALYSDFFDSEVLSHFAELPLIQSAVNYLLSDVRGGEDDVTALKNISGGSFVELIKLIASGDLSSRGAKDVLAVLLAEGGTPRDIATNKGLLQMKDIGAITALAKEIIDEQTAIVTEIKAGKLSGIKFLIGVGMKKSKGSVNPMELEKAISFNLGL